MQVGTRMDVGKCSSVGTGVVTPLCPYQNSKNENLFVGQISHECDLWDFKVSDSQKSAYTVLEHLS